MNHINQHPELDDFQSNNSPRNGRTCFITFFLLAAFWVAIVLLCCACAFRPPVATVPTKADTVWQVTEHTRLDTFFCPGDTVSFFETVACPPGLTDTLFVPVSSVVELPGKIVTAWRTKYDTVVIIQQAATKPPILPAQTPDIDLQVRAMVKAIMAAIIIAALVFSIIGQKQQPPKQ